MQKTKIPKQSKEGRACAHMEACKIYSAEAHNFREKDLGYVRKELSVNNFYSNYRISVVERDRMAREAYRANVGQKDQANFAPIQEIIVVGMIDGKQAEKFVEKLEKKYPWKVLSWAVHNDEGHTDPKTGDWIPNHHAHFIVDTTCWTHELQQVVVRKHGKIQRDGNGKIRTEKKDMYGRRIQYEVSALQDIAAEVTGLKRGKPSTVKHLGMVQYKIQEATKDYNKLLTEIEKLGAEKSQLEEQIKEKYEQVCELREMERKKCHGIKDAVKNMDSQLTELAGGAGLKLDRGYYQKRDAVLQKASQYEDSDDSDRSRSELFVSYTLLFYQVIDTLNLLSAELIRRCKKELAKLKALSLLRSLKAFLVTKLGKPATDQAKALQQRVNAVEAENAELRTAKEVAEKTAKEYKEGHMFYKDWYQQCTKLNEERREVERHRRDMDKNVSSFVDNLKTFGQKEDIIRLERFDIKRLLGQEQWESVKSHILKRPNHSGPSKGLKL